jgi:ParB family chromosome partitioning protein
MAEMINTGYLEHHPDNPRKDLGDLTELKGSIKSLGILQPLTVVTTKREGVYMVVIGHRRLEAAKLAGLDEVPCIVADMDRKAQVATMMIENLQRAGLTVLEQAKGFQMMLDLGDTVAAVSAQTGFGETTIRQRVKLCELNEKKMAEAELRGARIKDYIALEQITDVRARNKVLESIGTNNFNNALNAALKDQNRAKMQPILRKRLEQFAKEVKDINYNNHETVASCGYTPDPDREKEFEKKITKCEKDKTTKYFFTMDDWNVQILKVRAKQPAPTLSPDEIAAAKALKDRLGGLNRACETAYELRHDFVKTASDTAAKKALPEITALAIDEGYNFSEVAELLGLDYKGIDYRKRHEFILAAIREQPYRALLALAYAFTRDSKASNCHDSRGKQHSEASRHMTRKYAMLEAAGYVMSDEEKALLDGTHELYAK